MAAEVLSLLIGALVADAPPRPTQPFETIFTMDLGCGRVNSTNWRP